MPPQVVLLSGRVGAGKSTLAKALVDLYGAQLVKTREIIRAAFPGIELDREAYQAAGDVLDGNTGGQWIANGVLAAQNAWDQERSDRGEVPESNRLIVVDGVRIEPQIALVREAYRRQVTHVHLTVSEAEADRRLRTRERTFQDESYEVAKRSQTEANVESLAQFADVHIDTERDRESDVVVRVAARLGLLDTSPSSYVDLLVGGQYGSEGKGHISWHLAPEYDYLVRVGGPNAGHTVLSHGKFTFHTLPSGTGEAPGAKIVIGPGATISLSSLREELTEFSVTAERLSIDPQAVIIQPEDAAFEADTIRKTIASTAQGGGYAAARRLMRGALEPKRPVVLARDVPDLEPFLASSADVLQKAIAAGSRIFVEGTQGSGLSLFHGKWPYVTSRDTNVGGLLAESGIAPSLIRKIIMVIRSYPIRVQDPDEPEATSGELSREINWDIVAERSGLDADELKAGEVTSTTNRKRRVGEFDWVLYRRSVELNRPTDIALTHADYLNKENERASRFDLLTKETQLFVSELEAVADAPVSLISIGFHMRSIIDRRYW